MRNQRLVAALALAAALASCSSDQPAPGGTLTGKQAAQVVDKLVRDSGADAVLAVEGRNAPGVWEYSVVVVAGGLTQRWTQRSGATTTSREPIGETGYHGHFAMPRAKLVVASWTQRADHLIDGSCPGHDFAASALPDGRSQSRKPCDEHDRITRTAPSPTLAMGADRHHRHGGERAGCARRSF